MRDLYDFNFRQYSAYVICARAIPAVEDGLKPVQRRIMHALYEQDDGRYTKVANIVGQTMQYHPHGDASIGDAIVVLANKLWGKGNGYLIDGQGNYGSLLTGMPHAAVRYIECRLTELAKKEVFNKKTTVYVDNYDGRKKEPVYLPAKIPLLLMLGADGIAVGLSTAILPHNFIELLEAEICVIQKKPFEVYPDFQLGGVMDVSEYQDGLGKVKVRARIEKEDKNKLVITELPWGETTDSLAESIEDAIKKKKVPVRKLHDLTSDTVRIELELQTGESQEKAIVALYAFTNCEKSLSSRPIVLEGGRPRQMSVSEMLKCIAVVSANDCAVAMSEYLCGTEEAFVQRMNERAEELGLADTHFTNCTGLFDDDEHYTAAYDLAVMSRELIKHNLIKDYTTIWMDSIRNGEFGLSNTNKLVYYYEGCTGLKTGFTTLAGYCLSATAERDGVEYIAVIMHGETIEKRNEDAKTLLGYGFANYVLCPLRSPEVLPPVSVKLGSADCVQPIYSGEEYALMLRQGAGDAEYDTQLDDSVRAPVTEGQRLGTLTVSFGNGERFEVPLVAANAVDKAGFGKLLSLVGRAFLYGE